MTDYALSVRQPWASEIILGRKDVENRTWRPRLELPSRITIHASKAAEDPFHGYFAACRRAEVVPLAYDRPIIAGRLAALIGFATLTSIHHADDCHCSCSPWAADGQWHWLFERAHALDPFPWRGRLGLWPLPDDIWEQWDHRRGVA